MAAFDTYDYRVQLGAARNRRTDAISLQSSSRWNGAMYLAGYAIECSLKVLICHGEHETNLKDTNLYKKVQGASLHNLWDLFNAAPGSFQRAIECDNTGKLKNAWNTVVRLWRKDELRYGHKSGSEADCTRFFEAVHLIYGVILHLLGESR